MAVNQVIVGDEVKLDLTTDTVSEETLLEGVTAHNAAGEPIVGTMSSGSSGGGGGGTTYSPGDGVSISDRNEISARIDGETIQFDEDGKMYVPTVPLALENAIVIQENDAAYILHEYTTVEYIAGNRIGYAGAGNQIIVGGYTFGKDSGQAKSYQRCTFPFAEIDYLSPTFGKNVIVNCSLDNVVLDKYIYSIYVRSETMANGNRVVQKFSYDPSITSIYFEWREINPPITQFPYGCVIGKVFIKYKDSSGSIKYEYAFTGKFGFSSEAEYNAAVGLTYEPNTLTMIVDNKEVTG